jgi:DNA-binding NarL/FixJ family response regulator
MHIARSCSVGGPFGPGTGDPNELWIGRPTVSAVGRFRPSKVAGRGGCRPKTRTGEAGIILHGSAKHPTPITVVLVDDEQLIRSALGQALSADGLDLVGEAANAEAAINVVVDLRPDVVLIDLKLPGTEGVQTIEQLTLLAPATRILILTRSEQNQVVEAIIAGASGYILKNATPDAITAAIRATAAGETVISSQVAGKLLERIRERDIPIAASTAAASAIRAVLTARELEIFTRLASGKTNQQIGRELALSANTIHNHIASILHKLQLDNRIQAAVEAVRSGIS